MLMLVLLVCGHLKTASVKSRTGFIIFLGKAPIFWSCRMQTESALSTFKAEYVARSTTMGGLLPFQDILAEICKGVNLPTDIDTFISTTILEDNAACEKLTSILILLLDQSISE